MKKRECRAFGKKIYLLGTDNENKNIWLVEPSWDCGWYWGFGYLQTYTNNKNPNLAKDIASHTHFDSEILKGLSFSYNNFKSYFKETVLKDNEIWELCDYMKTFYTLKETAELFGRGYSHQTERAKIDLLKDEKMVEKINKELLPALFEKIIKLLSSGEEEQQ